MEKAAETRLKNDTAYRKQYDTKMSELKDKV